MDSGETTGDTRVERARKVADQLQGGDWVRATFEASGLLREMAGDLEAADRPLAASRAMLAFAARYCSRVESSGYGVHIGFVDASLREEFHRLWLAAVAEHKAKMK